MQDRQNIHEQRLADAWAEIQAQSADGTVLQPDAYRLAFSDPEFLLRRETRGIRFQLEMLKPDLAQSAAGVDNTIVVFGSARFPSPEKAEAAMQAATASGDEQSLVLARRGLRNSAHYANAQAFARLVSSHSLSCQPDERLYICTGGGPGIMEAANRGAHEVGAPSVALNITLEHEQSANPYVTPGLSFKFHYFALRKMHFMMRAKALVAFPGGFGTLDELFEVITPVQTRKSKPVPIVLFGREYWQRLINLEMLVEEGAIAEADLDLLHFADEPQAAWDYICDCYGIPVQGRG